MFEGLIPFSAVSILIFAGEIGEIPMFPGDLHRLWP